MRFRPAVVLTFLALAQPGRTQSVLQTILGGAPNGLPASSAILNTPVSAVGDAKGNVYAGINGAHQVVRIDPSGTIWVVAGTGVSGFSGDGGPATAAALTSPMGLAVDTAGNLYICDSGANRIRRVSPDGIIATVAGGGKGGGTGDGGIAVSATLAGPSAIALDIHGNLLIADTSNNEIRAVTPDGIIHRVGGTGNQGTGGNGGDALSAPLNAPAGVAADNAGNIFIADTGNKWIQKITPDGVINRYAGVDSSNVSPFGGGDPTMAVNNALISPTSIAVDRLGNVYFVESGAPRVKRITPNGKIESYAGTGTGGGSGDGGLAKSANLNVLGIGIDANNNLLIADGVNNRVRIVTAADEIINTLAGDGLPSLTPRALAANGDYLYFSDGTANRIRRFNTKTGELTVFAGTGSALYSGDGGDAGSASLNSPRGLAFDKSGNLFVADSNNNRVRKITPAGIITTAAGTGDSSTAGDGGQATSASIHEPTAVALDDAGNLYIAEQLGNVVRKVTTAGVISTVAGTGTGGPPDSETGVATQQKLSQPQGLAWDPSGALLIADSGNSRVRRLTADGTITTVAGSKTPGSTGDGGPATAASLRGPYGVTVDSFGNLYIADTSNHEIRVVGPDGIITPVAGTGKAAFNGDGSPATAYSLSSPYAVLPGSNCSVLIADTGNSRIRQLSASVDYSITTNPPGLQITIDGQPVTTPAVVSLLPGTQHVIASGGPQSGPSGTRDVLPASQQVNVSCGAPRSSLVVSFQTQYLLTATADQGGSVAAFEPWQAAGATVALNAVPQSGFVFSGWEGDCNSGSACKLVMDGPKNVKADFAPAQVSKPAIASGGVESAGLSTPPVTSLSAGAAAVVFGTGFAPAGTQDAAGTSNLIAGKISTEMDGVCVMVGSTPAPILALAPGQINFVVPQTLGGATASVQVVTGCGSSSEQRSDAVNAAVQSAAPEFFYFSQTASGQNPIAALDLSTGIYVGPTGMLARAASAPAQPGDLLALYATGLGVSNPPLATGQLPTAATPIAGDIQVTVGGTQLAAADILYAGVAPSNAGLYQINIRLPASIPDGNQPALVVVNGYASPAGGYIAVKR